MALVVVMFAFLLRATLTMGFSTVVEQIVGTVTAPLQSLSASLSGSVTGFLDQFLHAQEIAEARGGVKFCRLQVFIPRGAKLCVKMHKIR